MNNGIIFTWPLTDNTEVSWKIKSAARQLTFDSSWPLYCWLYCVLINKNGARHTKQNWRWHKKWVLLVHDWNVIYIHKKGSYQSLRQKCIRKHLELQENRSNTDPKEDRKIHLRYTNSDIRNYFKEGHKTPTKFFADLEHHQLTGVQTF